MVKLVLYVSLVLPQHFLNLFALTPLVNMKHFFIYALLFSMCYIATLTPTYSITSYRNTIFD